MGDKWTNIAITTPGYLIPSGEVACSSERIISQEADLICSGLLDSKAADIVHIRKPEWSPDMIGLLISKIHQKYHSRLRLHDHFRLLDEYPEIGGVHLNSRNPIAPPNARCVSASCHSIEEIDAKAAEYDYVTLSPVFDSISKPGYTGRFADKSVSSHLRGKNVIALGGVVPECFLLLKQLGYSGAAMLGHLWQDCTADRYPSIFNTCISAKAIASNFSLQFVTDGKDVEETVAQVRDAVKGGCRWIQIRMKGKSTREYDLAVDAVRDLCEQKSCTLLVDDNVDTAARKDIGVHLGKDDMSTPQARNIIAPSAILGRTANNEDDLIDLENAPDVNYIGLGPFRFTQTKRKLAPVIGLEGYALLMESKRLRGSHKPVVAIGGITPEDVAPLLATGVDGVAVSGAIAHASDRVEATRRFVNEINKYYNKQIL